MNLVSYVDLPLQSDSPSIKLGALLDDGNCVLDFSVAQTWAQGARGFAARSLPDTMLDLLRHWDEIIPHLNDLLKLLGPEDCLNLKGSRHQPVARRRTDVILLPPLPNVLSLRLFDAFEMHVRNRCRLQSKAIPTAWHEAPAFVYGNSLTIIGPDRPLSYPEHGRALDYGLQVACVIRKEGQDIPAERADEHIAGYMLLNDWALRDIDGPELVVGSRPAKGGDFATTLGPALVTPDTLVDRQTGEGAELRYDLTLTATVNGEERTRANLKDMYWTFAQMIERASQDVMLFPGEVLASGVVPMGSLFEQDAADNDGWLHPGDRLEVTAERLGQMETHIIVPS